MVIPLFLASFLSRKEAKELAVSCCFVLCNECLFFNSLFTSFSIYEEKEEKELIFYANPHFAANVDSFVLLFF
jgi:hypothetical protein